MATKTADRRVAPETLLAAIRSDEVVGSGSGSVIEEWSDDDLLVEFARVSDKRRAVEAARRIHCEWVLSQQQEDQP